MPEDDSEDDVEDEVVDVEGIRESLADEPIIMNAIRDNETGEMVATDVISASRVTARFRNVAERAGSVSIEFDVMVPAQMQDSRWQLKLYPMMNLMDDELALEPVFITGKAYRQEQLKGHKKYDAYEASILTDTADLVYLNQYDIFFQRQNIFGVSSDDALHHYRRRARVYVNERKKQRRNIVFRRYVKDPIRSEGIRLDTVMTTDEGDFLYRYRHTFASRPKLKKVMIALQGEIYEGGRCMQALPIGDELTFYVSTLSSMADMSPKYRYVILEKTVYDNTKALIDFKSGSAEIDSLMSDNASELERIMRCIGDVKVRTEYVLDSLVVKATCSPEGAYGDNARLASARAESVREYLMGRIPTSWRDKVHTSGLPENWEQLRLLVKNDTVMKATAREQILAMTADLSRPDEVEAKLSRRHEYRYLREKIYPKLRAVNLEFYLRREGIQEDTVHLTIIDTVYMSGLEALQQMDYKKAVEALRPYRDYNSALALVAADYNHTALDILNALDDTDAKVCYLKALVLSRLGVPEEAGKYFELSIAYDPYLEHRANLDPEMSELVRKRQTHINY